MDEMKKMEPLCRDNKSRDFFDPEKEFFLIDSEHLDEVKTHFYGYSVQSNGIFEQENFTKEAADALDGCGAYLYVERLADGQIRIQQDFNGSWGIYLYRNGDYFALSSSFFRLLEHIKTRFPLTLDRNYANYLLLASLCTHSYAETAVEEIKLIDKDVVLFIDTENAQLRFEYTEYAEVSTALDTMEGMATLDRWFEKWTTLFRNLQARTNNISTCLSGGFDSRITFLLTLCSRIDLNDIQVFSIHNNLHTHAEDYEIASEIANYYGFKLNNKDLDKQAFHYSLKDSINISYYTKLATHKQMFFKTIKVAKKRYIISGAGGEALRSHWNQTAERFISGQSGRARRYTSQLAQEIANSTEKIHWSAFRAADEKFGVEEVGSTRYPMYLYRLTRCRHHFGKEAVERLFSNDYELAPLLDPDIRSLKLETAECSDRNLLVALICVRYCPSLLDFRFEGGRSIRPETIDCARKINEAFPRAATVPAVKSHGPFQVITQDKRVLEVLQSGQDNPALPAKATAQYMKTVFDSCSFQKLFATYFDEELYDFAKQYAEEKDYVPMQECYGIIGITAVIEDVVESRCQPTLTQSLDYFIEENPYEPDNLTELVKRLKNDLTARVDIKLTGTDANLELAWISDVRASVKQPKWLQKDGVGYVIEAYHGTLDLKLHVCAGEKLSIRLRGRDVRNEQGEQVPYWITYQTVRYNGEEEIQGAQNACHGKSITLSHSVQDGDMVTLHLEWAPCRYTEEKTDLLEAKISLQEEKLTSLKKNLSSLKKENASLKKKVASMRSSYSWRLGRALTWPVRKLRGLLAKRRK